MSPPRLHIGFVLEWFPPHTGGVETLFDQLTSALVRDGYEVSIVTTLMRGVPRVEVRNGVRIFRVRTPDFLHRYLFTLLAIPVALRVLRGADVIHTTTYNAAIPGWIVARIHRVPSVVTVHEVWGDQWNKLSGLNRWAGYGFRFFEWTVLHLPFARFICDSRFSEGRLRAFMKVEAGRTAVVYPAVDYDFWDRARHEPFPLRARLGIPGDAFVYLYFGRPGISKGVEQLIDAAQAVRAGRPDSRLVLILARDPIGQYEQLRRRIASLGLDDHVMVLDPVPRAQLPGHLLAADCICVPSISEGFGYAAVEASTLGCTVVTTTGHSVEEVMPRGAIFVPPADPVALADAILRVAGGERLYPTSLPRYDIASHVRGVEEVYEKIRKALNR